MHIGIAVEVGALSPSLPESQFGTAISVHVIMYRYLLTFAAEVAAAAGMARPPPGGGGDRLAVIRLGPAAGLLMTLSQLRLGGQIRRQLDQIIQALCGSGRVRRHHSCRTFGRGVNTEHSYKIKKRVGSLGTHFIEGRAPRNCFSFLGENFTSEKNS